MLILVMLVPLAAISLQIVPGRPLIPAGGLLAVGSVVLATAGLIGPRELRKRACLRAVGVIWTLTALVATSTVFWSPLPGLTLQRVLLVFVAGVVLVHLVSADRQPARTLQWMARGLVALAAILGVIGIGLLAVGQIRWTSDGIVQSFDLGVVTVGQRLVGAPPFLRITSLAGNPNGLATWLVFGLIMLPIAMPSRRRRHWRLILGLPIVAALVLTMSRTGLAAAVLGAIIFQTVSRGLRWSTFAPLALGALILTASLALILDQVGLDVTTTDRVTLSLSDREAAWRPLTEAWQQRPWTGQGFGVGYEALLQERGLHFGAHSGHLALLAEFGLLGYAGVLVLWIMAAFRGLAATNVGRMPREAGAACLAVLAAYFVQQFFEASLLRFTFASFFWLYSVAACAGVAVWERDP
jgi:hypothetical protein